MKLLSKPIILLLVIISVVIVVGGFGVSPLFAQSTDIAGLMSKSKLTQAEKQAIDGWISNQLTMLASVLTKPISADYTIPKRERAVTGITKTIVNTSKGSVTFRKAFLSSLGKQISSNVDKVDVKVAIREAVLMVNLADGVMVDSFVSLLDAKEPALKSLALEGLSKLAGNISADKANLLVNKVAKIISVTNEQVLASQGYQLLAKIDNKSARSALVSALTVRARKYIQEGGGDYDADRALVESIAKVSKKFDDKTKKQVIQSLTDILKVSVGLIVSKSILLPDAQGRAEMLIYSTEKTLSGLTGKNTKLPVTNALKQANWKKAKDALKLWMPKNK